MCAVVSCFCLKPLMCAVVSCFCLKPLMCAVLSILFLFETSGVYCSILFLFETSDVYCSILEFCLKPLMCAIVCLLYYRAHRKSSYKLRMPVGTDFEMQTSNGKNSVPRLIEPNGSGQSKFYKRDLAPTLQCWCVAAGL